MTTLLQHYKNHLLAQQCEEEKKAPGEEPGDEGILDAFACSAAWEDAWLRAIARAWEDSVFKRTLLENPKLAFEELGWPLPCGLTLTVKEYAGEKKYERDKSVDGVYANGWRHMKGELAGEVTVILPPAPDEKYRAVALVDFKGTGKVYPFTT